MVFRPFPSLVAVLAVLIVDRTAFASADSGYLNVYGQTLQSCSSDGMALTGWTRTGHCIDRYGDSGSHHICIDLSSLGGGNENDGDNQNFCDVTGQYDWCSSQDMPCHEDQDTSACPVTNWCVCQWAFASYIQASGGCDNIQTVVCDSINLQALLAYQNMAKQSNAEQKYEDALECLVERCGLTSSQLAAASLLSSNTSSRFGVYGVFLVAAILAGVAGSAHFYRKHMTSKTIQLNNDGIAIGDEKDFVANTEPRLL